MVVTTKEFLNLCKRFNPLVEESDITGVGFLKFYTDAIKMTVYSPNIDGNGNYETYNDVLIDTRNLNKCVRDSIWSLVADNIAKKYSSDNLKLELLGVGDTRWYRLHITNEEYLTKGAAVATMVYKTFDDAVEKEIKRLIG